MTPSNRMTIRLTCLTSFRSLRLFAFAGVLMTTSSAFAQATTGSNTLLTNNSSAPSWWSQTVMIGSSIDTESPQGMRVNGSTVVGADALSETWHPGNPQLGGSSNGDTAIGYRAMIDAARNGGTSQNNVAVGAMALNAGGQNHGSSFFNVAIGPSAMEGVGSNNSDSSSNIAIGIQALAGAGTQAGAYVAENIVIGARAMYGAAPSGMTTGNIVIGSHSGEGATTAVQGSVIIGGHVPSAKTGEVILADGFGNLKMVMDADGNVGIGTSTPGAKLEVKGTVKLGKYTSAPFACSAASDGALAMTSTYTLCVCRGAQSGWYPLLIEARSACIW